MELASAGPRGGGSPSLSPGEGQGVDAATSSLARLTLVCAGNALCQLSDRTYLFGQVVIEPQLCHDARGLGGTPWVVKSSTLKASSQPPGPTSKVSPVRGNIGRSRKFRGDRASFHVEAREWRWPAFGGDGTPPPGPSLSSASYGMLLP